MEAGTKKAKSPLQQLSFEQWKGQVDQALNSICADDLHLSQVPQTFDLRKRYDAGDDIIRTANAAYFVI
jgi:hypothetical protein